MLARLETIEGITHASVDYGGNYMRLSLATLMGLTKATVVLRELGYEPELVDDGGAVPAQWYDTASVDDLSAIEAKVIAQRVVERFTRANSVARDAADRLRTAVAAALQRCFSARQTSDTAITGEFRTDCLRVAGAAATEILGASGATAFVAALEADLNEDHTHDAGL